MDQLNETQLDRPAIDERYLAPNESLRSRQVAMEGPGDDRSVGWTVQSTVGIVVLVLMVLLVMKVTMRKKEKSVKFDLSKNQIKTYAL